MLIKISSVTLHTNHPDPTIDPAQRMGRLGFSPNPSPFSPAWLLRVVLAQKPESNDHAVTNHPQKVIQRALNLAEELPSCPGAR